MKAIAYGYGVTHSDAKPAWVVHPDCSERLKKRLPDHVVMMTVFHGNVRLKAHPLYRASCWVCERRF